MEEKEGENGANVDPITLGVSLTYDMITSPGLGLLALLRRIRIVRSIGNALKSFIPRGLLFWPHFLRNVRHILSLLSGRIGTSPRDDGLKKNGGHARPSYPRASGVCEGYGAICASRDFNRAGEPHLGPDGAEVLHLDTIVRQSQSAPPSPATSLAPSSPGSDRHFADSSSFIAADNIQMPDVPHLNSPLTMTHSRSTSTQFAGVPRQSRSRSRSRSRFPQLPQLNTPQIPRQIPAASSNHSRPPSRSPSQVSSPRSLTFPEPSVPDSPGSTHVHYSEGSRPPSIHILPPSRSQTAQSLSVNPVRLSFPSQETLRDSDIPSLTDSGDWSDGKKRSIGLMHSEQVSRYVSKGAM